MTAGLQLEVSSCCADDLVKGLRVGTLSAKSKDIASPLSVWSGLMFGLEPVSYLFLLCFGDGTVDVCQ